MNGYLFIAAFSMLLGGIFSIATSSIAIECYNKNETIKKEKENNFNFLISNLVCAILLVIVGCLSIYFAFKPTAGVVKYGQQFQQAQYAPNLNIQQALNQQALNQQSLNQLSQALKDNPQLAAQLLR
jgi:hypothetical protein